MLNLLKRNAQTNRTNQPSTLQLEALESRMMLSSVQIFASGDLGGEQFDLQIDGQTVQQFTVSQEPSVFEFQTDQTISADQVRIQFTNDFFDPANGIDSNLVVDAIEIDGTRFETESPTVFSTGTFTDADGIVDGFGRGETLHTNGFFQFSSAGASVDSGSLEVRARGFVGNEQFNVIVDGQIAGTFTASTQDQSFFVDAGPDATPGDVQVEFLNDQFDPANGIDSNLVVDFITVNGQTVQTEDGSVFSTGTFTDADGIVDGFGRGEILHTNGFFQFADLEASVDSLGTIAVGPGGFQAVNSDLVADADGVGPAVAFTVGGASGDVDFINAGNLSGVGQAPATSPDAGDGIRVAGSGPFTGSIVNADLINSDSTQGTTAGFRAVNGVDFQGELVNLEGALISGAQNGVYFGTGDNSGAFFNNGTVVSDSRAVNIDGDGLNVVNTGAIIGTGDQRNGTVYSDNTASNFEISNSGLIEAGADNDGAGISLSLNNDGSNGEINVFNNGVVLGRGQASAGLATAGDGIRLEGDRSSDGIPPGLFEGSVVNNGQISSDSAQGTTAGFRTVNGLSFQGDFTNTGLLTGVQNGLYFGTGDHDGGTAANSGTIASGSRAVNIDGDGLEFFNTGLVVGTGNQRNGTLYVDGTADNFQISNLEGRIDAGEFNDGSGVAIETGDQIGDQVAGEVNNTGIIQGRGTSTSGNTIGHGLRFIGGAGTDGTAEFTGQINNSGVISGALDNGSAAGISIEDVGVSGLINNTGVIEGSSVAIDATTANGGVDLFNDGTINGDVLFGAGADSVTVNSNGSFNGQIDGGSGVDRLNINFGDFEQGVEFANNTDINNFEIIFIDGQRFV